MITKIILREELNKEELWNLELLFRETDKAILDEFLILTDSPELAGICRKFDIAVAAVLTGNREAAAGAGEDTDVCGGEKAVGFERAEREAAGTVCACAAEGSGRAEDLDRESAGNAACQCDGDFQGISYAVTDIEDLDDNYLERIWQRYRGIPWKICETERCLVRESVPEDVDSFYEIYRDREITEYMEDLYEDREKERQYIRDYIEKVYAFYGFGMWTVCLKETGEVIGRAGLSMREGFEEPELGYVIGKTWQRQGIAAEVCLEILNYAGNELGLEQIRALMHPENTASQRLCHRLGFYYEREIEVDGIFYRSYRIEISRNPA